MNRSDRESGTVLFSTLLVMTVMSAVALALLATVRSAITRTGSLDARAQLDLYAQAARDFAGSQLLQVTRLDGPQQNAQLARLDPFLLPFENGSISLSVRDGTQCFRLSSLSSPDGTGSDTAQQQFESLMIALAIDRSTASRVAASAVDWVDRDAQTRPGGAEDGIYLSRQISARFAGPHRTANVPMVSVTELRAVDGMTEADFRRLRPHLCIGTAGQPTPFNIDGALPQHAPVLAAILGGGPTAEQLAIDLIENRPAGGYGTLEALQAMPGMQDYENAAAQFSDIVFSPARLTIEVRIGFAQMQTAQLLAYEGLDSGRPTLSYRAWGQDEFPSIAWIKAQAVLESDRP